MTDKSWETAYTSMWISSFRVRHLSGLYMKFIAVAHLDILLDGL